MDGELLSAAAKGDLRRMRERIDRGADLWACDAQGRSAFALAAMHGRADCVAAFCSPRALSALDRWGRSALMLAAMEGHPACVEILLARMEEATARDFDGRDALTLAARKGCQESAALLMAKSAPGSRDFRGLSAAQVARKAGHESLARILEKWMLESNGALAA